MSDRNSGCSNEAMKKIIGNMTAEMQNIDGQYVPLAFTPPPVASETLRWPQQQSAYISHYNTELDLGYAPIETPMEQFPQSSFNYMQQPTPNLFDSSSYSSKSLNDLSEFDMFNHMRNGTSDLGVFNRDFTPYLSPNVERSLLNNIVDGISPSQHDSTPHLNNHLIENLVGNWTMPNNTGTYSPFGNTDNYNPNMGVFHPGSNVMSNGIVNPGIDEQIYMHDQPFEDKQFLFSRDNKKPRVVAEIKPMRPSYSDVLTKPVPQTVIKPMKNDQKEAKPKKDSKKGSKNDKSVKNGGLNRNNTTGELKDGNAEKNTQPKSDKATKIVKPGQLNRKWASLDNISEPLINIKIDETKKKKNEDNNNKSYSKTSTKNKSKMFNEISDTESVNYKSEVLNITKNNLKKVNKTNSRPKSNDSFGGNERPPGKRNQRTRKRENHVPFGIVGQKLKQYLKGWWKIFTVFLLWLFHLISDICSLSIHISKDMTTTAWSWLRINCTHLLDSTASLLQRVRFFTWIWEKFKWKQKKVEESQTFSPTNLQKNMTMPTTGDEAMKRLLACKGKDPYSILGVTPTCSDDDIKRYYKRQAFLVHPDKNQQPGAEEAFKILVHAFDMIGEPERRATYDRGVVESAQVVQAWTELTELLSQLQAKVEAAANTIRCSACGLRHKRVKVDRPSYAARNCTSCKIHHAAREGDIWAEARVFGFLWNYYACMEGGVYDITDWAGCQKGSLKHLKPDSHHVQYRIALGKQTSQPRRQSTSPTNNERPDLENLLNTFNNLYGHSDSSQQSAPRSRRSKKSNK